MGCKFMRPTARHKAHQHIPHQHTALNSQHSTRESGLGHFMFRSTRATSTDDSRSDPSDAPMQCVCVRVHKKDYNFAESLTNTPHPIRLYSARHVTLVYPIRSRCRLQDRCLCRHGPASHPHSATPTGRLRRAETPPRPHWTKSTRESDMMTMPAMSHAVVLVGLFM